MTSIQGEKTMRMRRTLMAAMASFPFFSKPVMAAKLPRQPICFPFNAAQKGTVLTFDFEAIEDNLYTFILILQWNENDKSENARIAKFMGDGGYDPKTYKRLNNGMPIPLNLKISRLDPAVEVSTYDRDINGEELEAYRADSTSFSKIIDKIKMLRGNYRIHVEALQVIPELAVTPIKFGIYIHRL